MPRQQLEALNRHCRPNLIKMLKRSPGKPVFPHGSIDAVDGNSLLQEHQSFSQVGRLQAIYQKARTVLHHQRQFTPAPGKVIQGRDGLVRGMNSANDFDQLHLMHRRQKMHPGKPLRPPAIAGQFRDGNPRGVADDNCRGLNPPVGLPDDLSFRHQIFRHRLDHQVGTGKTAEIGRWADQVHFLQHRFRCQLAVRHLGFEQRPGRCQRPGKRQGIDILQAHRMIKCRRQLRNIPPHNPGADNTDFIHVFRHQ